MKKKSESAKPPVKEKKKYNYTKKTGSPSIYTPELGERIAALIAANPTSVGKLCKQHSWMPNQVTIYEWIAKKPDFGKMYLEAKQKQVLVYIEQTEDFLESDERDFYVDKEGYKKPHSVAVSRDALKLKHRHWQAARLMSKVFGDRPEELHQQNQALVATVATLQAKIDELNKKHEKDY